MFSTRQQTLQNKEESDLVTLGLEIRFSRRRRQELVSGVDSKKYESLPPVVESSYHTGLVMLCTGIWQVNETSKRSKCPQESEAWSITREEDTEITTMQDI